MNIGNRTLNPDILGSIFNIHLPGVGDVVSRRKLTELCLVSKEWRDAAILNSRLWSKVKLEIRTKSQSFSSKKTLAWIKRSRGYPKTLEVAISCYGKDDYDSCPSDSCSATNLGLIEFMLYVPALQHLSIEVKSAQCFKNLCASMKHQSEQASLSPARSLDSPVFPVNTLALKVVQFNSEDHASSSRNGFVFDMLPPVSNVRLELPRIKETLSYTRHPDETACSPGKLFPPKILQQLTCLSLRSHYNLAKIAPLLKECSNLEDLSLFYCSKYHYARPRSTDNETIALPKVRVLRLKNIVKDTMNILGVLQLKVLSHFELSCGKASSRTENPEVLDDPTLLKTFIQSHANTLRYLRIHNLTIDGPVLQAILPASLGVLEHLVLDRVGFKVDVFQHWMDTPPTEEEGGKWFPNLKTLELHDLDTDYDMGTLFSFLRARRPYRVESGQDGQNEVIFLGPPDSIQRLVVTFRLPSLKRGERQAHSEEVEKAVRILERGGVVVELGSKYLKR
ncbi:hypothetical protein DFP72DRAFT_1074874 [Ephemerocybe angulata]|uniref:F-box domain-containing protein n=1 Tax=Ephemerocybe angulata TaxID=980116 RepID=A0A8H6LZI4_9AGAR|nr:hypothetical protein DFP72DRAFT_1074874 [Tulosesus angulatus]